MKYQWILTSVSAQWVHMGRRLTGPRPPQDPNPEDPLNKEAAEMLQGNQRQFEHSVQASIMRGAHIGSSYFPLCRA
jgi:hypothetical protein